MRCRTGDKEIKRSRFLQPSPRIICSEQPERLRNNLRLLPLHEAPTRRNNQSVRVNSSFLVKKYKESRKIWETI